MRRSGLPAYAVVMAGGESTRLWPLARARRPKVLLPLAGRQSLLQRTVANLSASFGLRRILIVTGAEIEAEVRRQLPRIPRDHILVEPASRNTAACLALAADWLATYAGDVVMLATPADHVVADVAGLRRALDTAVAVASAQGCLVVVGVAARRPESGYGYLERGKGLEGFGESAFWARRFHEKPAPATARRYIRSGRHLWSTGIFAWRVSVFQRALAQCAPQISAAMGKVYASLRGRRARLRRAYRSVPAQPVDLALLQPISERKDAAARIAVVRGAFDWLDAGNWNAIAALWPRDADGNVVRGRALAIDSRNSVVYCPDRLVTLIGVTDLIVVDGGEVVLVCPRHRAQDVRQAAAALKHRGWDDYL